MLRAVPGSVTVGVGFVTGVVTGVGVGVGVGAGVVVVGGGVPTLTTGMIGTPTGMWLIGNSGHPCRSRCLWGSSTLVVGAGSGSEVVFGAGSGLVVPVFGSRVPRGPCGSGVTGGLGSGTPIRGGSFGLAVGGGSFGLTVGGSSFRPVGGSNFLPVGGSFGLAAGGTGSGAPLCGAPGLGSQVGGGFGFGTTRLLWTWTVRAELGKLDAAGVKTSPTSVTAMAPPPLERGWLSTGHQHRCVTTLPKTDHGGLRFDRQLDLVR